MELFAFDMMTLKVIRRSIVQLAGDGFYSLFYLCIYVYKYIDNRINALIDHTHFFCLSRHLKIILRDFSFASDRKNNTFRTNGHKFAYDYRDT